MGIARPCTTIELFPSKDLPHQFVVVLFEDVNEVYFWCLDHFGPHGGPLPQRYFVCNTGHFYFSRSDDAMEFKLRWC
jgi:hypothetical protein